MDHMSEELSGAIINGTSFFNAVEAFEFSLNHIDIFDKTSKKNFDNIGRQIMRTNAILPYSKDFVKTDLETNKLEAALLCEDILGKNSGEPLMTLPIEKKTMPLFDGGTLFHYDGEKRTITATNIILFRTDLSYNALSLVHENTHILFNQPAPEKGFHIHYNELLPILMELIAISRFEKTLNDPNLLKYYLDIRIKTLRDHFEKYSGVPFLKTTNVNGFIPFPYSIHNSYSYIICTIYALRLFELYKANPKTIQQLIQKAISHQITVEQFLQETSTSLKNKETINATEKVLKMYQK